MDIAIIEPVGGHGGMDYYDYGLAYGLGENGVNVYFYTSDKTKIRQFKNVETKFYFNKVWGSSFLKKTFFYIIGHCRAYADSKRNNVKIVHLHFFFFRGIDLLMILIAKAYRLKVIVTVHDVNSFRKNTIGFIEKLCYKFTDGIIVHNNYSLEKIAEKAVKINKIAVIPHGNYLHYITPVAKNPKPSNPFTILFFGQIKKVKGLDVLIKAVAEIIKINKDIEVIIAGRVWKNDLNTYKKMIEELYLTKFIKTDFRYLQDEEVTSLYNQADLVVLPYKEIYQSGVLLLTMSYGKPLLCSDLKPFTEVIKDKETGFIFKSENANDLAAKILDIIDNPALLDKVSESALKAVKEDFDWIFIGSKTRDFYKEIN